MGLCREIYQERLPDSPVKIMRGGEMDRDVLNLLLANVRTPKEREGDLGAQIAACHTGAERLREICERYGRDMPRSTGPRPTCSTILTRSCALFLCESSCLAHTGRKTTSTTTV